ncbi:TPA: hypothetical protein ACJCQV_000633, partial [Neisseria meningitidis]
TIPPKTVSGRLDLSFGIFARRGEKYSCYGSMNRQKYPNRHSRAGGNLEFQCLKNLSEKNKTLPSSFPRKWESRNEKQQEFIGNDRN